MAQAQEKVHNWFEQVEYEGQPAEAGGEGPALGSSD